MGRGGEKRRRDGGAARVALRVQSRRPSADCALLPGAAGHERSEARGV